MIPRFCPIFNSSILAVAGQELAGALLPGVLDDLPGVALFHNHASVHEYHLVGHVPGESHLMGDDDHGGLLFGQGADHPQHLAGELRVQGGGGLVKAEDIGAEGQGPGDGHPLLLAAGELVGVMPRPVGQTHLGQQRPSLLLDLSEDALLLPLKVGPLPGQELAGQLLARERPDFKGEKKRIFAEIEEKGRTLLAQMGLADRAGHYPHQLSGGQQQRVAIARALALSPDILCFDEPTSALDPELTGEVLRVIRALAEQKTTMIIVTHEMAFARDVADQVVFMDGGVIVEQGDARQVIEHPREERTRQFLARYSEN